MADKIEVIDGKLVVTTNKTHTYTYTEEDLERGIEALQVEAEKLQGYLETLQKHE